MLLAAPAMMMLGAVLGLQGIESWLAAFGTSPESYQTLGRVGLAVPCAADGVKVKEGKQRSLRHLVGEIGQA